MHTDSISPGALAAINVLMTRFRLADRPIGSDEVADALEFIAPMHPEIAYPCNTRWLCENFECLMAETESIER